MVESQKNLPINKYKNEFKEFVTNNDIILIAGDTGCGKSTQIPQFLIDLGYKHLLCTQLRRIACISLCKRVSYELLYAHGLQGFINARLGNVFYVKEDDEAENISIGYQIRFDKTYLHQSKSHQNYLKEHAKLSYDVEDDNNHNNKSKESRSVSDENFVPSQISRQENFDKLIFMTEGILLRLLGSDPELSSFDCVLIDEVHERHCTTDFILGCLKLIVEKAKSSGRQAPFKLILMSATINTQLFLSYFPGCAFLQVPGRLYPIETLYMPLADDEMLKEVKRVEKMDKGEEIYRDPSQQSKQQYKRDEYGRKLSQASPQLSENEMGQDQDIVDNNVQEEDKNKPSRNDKVLKPEPYVRLLKLIDTKYGSPYIERGDVLVFLPGVQDIENIKTALQEYSVNSCPDNDSNKGSKEYYDSSIGGSSGSRPSKGGNARSMMLSKSQGHWIILPLHASLATKDQDRVFEITPPGFRKCVLATNVAETSVTIDGIRFVIDSGKVKELHYDAVTKMSKLKTFWISRAAAEQRKGRAGRTGPGVCFRLYHAEKHFAQLFSDYATSEILKVPIHTLVLQILAVNDSTPLGHEKLLPFNDIQFFPFIESPDPSSLDASILYLLQHGALKLNLDPTIPSATDESKVLESQLDSNVIEQEAQLHAYSIELTTFGKLLSQLPLDITVAKMLITAYLLNYTTSSSGKRRNTKLVEITLTLCSLFSVRSIYNSRAHADLKKYLARKEDGDLESPEHGDPFTLFNLFNRWVKLKLECAPSTFTDDKDEIMKRISKGTPFRDFSRRPNDNNRSQWRPPNHDRKPDRANQAKRWCLKVGVEEQRLYECLKLRRQFELIMKRHFHFSRSGLGSTDNTNANNTSTVDENTSESSENEQSNLDLSKERSLIKRLKRERLDKGQKIKMLKIEEYKKLNVSTTSSNNQNSKDSLVEHYDWWDQSTNSNNPTNGERGDNEDDQYDSDLDIEDIELKLTQTSHLKKIYVDELTMEDISMIKYILLSGLYPQIGIPDAFNSFKRGSDLIYHTKEKPFVTIHPNSSLTSEPELYLTSSASLGSDTILLGYTSLLETTNTKPHLLNPFTLKEPSPYMMLYAETINLAITSTYLPESLLDLTKCELIFDGWLRFTFLNNQPPDTSNKSDTVSTMESSNNHHFNSAELSDSSTFVCRLLSLLGTVFAIRICLEHINYTRMLALQNKSSKPPTGDVNDSNNSKDLNEPSGEQAVSPVDPLLPSILPAHYRVSVHALQDAIVDVLNVSRDRQLTSNYTLPRYEVKKVGGFSFKSTAAASNKLSTYVQTLMTTTTQSLEVCSETQTATSMISKRDELLQLGDTLSPQVCLTFLQRASGLVPSNLQLKLTNVGATCLSTPNFSLPCTVCGNDLFEEFYKPSKCSDQTADLPDQTADQTSEKASTEASEVKDALNFYLAHAVLCTIQNRLLATPQGENVNKERYETLSKTQTSQSPQHSSRAFKTSSSSDAVDIKLDSECHYCNNCKKYYPDMKSKIAILRHKKSCKGVP